MDCMELHGLELCIRMAMAAYIDEDCLMVRADRIGSDRIGSDANFLERLLEEAWDFWKRIVGVENKEREGN
jgi:hypothetical protein